MARPHLRHSTKNDFDALDQLRLRHQLLLEALMAVERKVRSNKRDDALELIKTALKQDKEI